VVLQPKLVNRIKMANQCVKSTEEARCRVATGWSMHN